MQHLLYEKIDGNIENSILTNNTFVFIAGPCSVDNEKQLMSIAEKIKLLGASYLRGGAFKPRTSPYSFQGLGKAGIAILSKAKKEFNIPLVCELLDINDLNLYDDIDIIQIGARNMYNYPLLKALSKLDKPLLLKRSFGAKLEELLMSAEYILQGGNSKIILCERGVRGFDNNTILDLNSVIKLRQITKLPIIVDPTHGSDNSSFVSKLSLAASTLDINGLMLEVNDHAEIAKSDGFRAITTQQFDCITKQCLLIRKSLNFN